MIRQQCRPSDFNLRPKIVEKLIAAAEGNRDKLVVALFAYTGMRRAELRDLRIEDVLLSDRRVVIRKGKGCKLRVVFIPDSLVENLRSLFGDRKIGPVFPNRDGRPLSLRSINNIVTRVAQSAGIRNPNPRYANVTPHLLRHSFARNWKRADGSLESLQTILGHASITTTIELYGTESLDETEDNYRKMVGRLVGDDAT